MTDPYEILGVARDASADEIKKVYRRLAKALHPDANPGDAAVEERFKRVSAAYAILSDPEMRARYDQGELDAEGRQQGFSSRAAGGGFGGFAGGFRVEDILGDLFGGHFDDHLRQARGVARGPDVTGAIEIDFVEAARGGKRRVTLPDGRALDIAIPPGIEDGQTIRLKGQGGTAGDGAAPGDALIRISVASHPSFRREGRHVSIDLPVSVPEAVLGARVQVPTIDGPVAMTVPANSNTGDTLRLRGKGLPDPGGAARGDQLVRLKVMLPTRPDSSFTALVRDWASRHAYDVR